MTAGELTAIRDRGPFTGPEFLFSQSFTGSPVLNYKQLVSRGNCSTN